jgi:ketosteroid isomerase-like protein
MNMNSGAQRAAMQLLNRMFEVEMRFLKSDAKDVSMLASAFHKSVVVHEPASLPYAGDWRGLEGMGELFRRMSDAWSDVRVEDLEALKSDNTVFMACTLYLTSRANGATIKQPFAEVLRFKDGLLLEGTPFYYDTSEVAAALH